MVFSEFSKRESVVDQITQKGYNTDDFFYPKMILKYIHKKIVNYFLTYFFSLLLEWLFNLIGEELLYAVSYCLFQC